ncbi:hypothetical protein PG999_010042 [Apiospora kogelbergensis]|uniref:FAD dependent oxidoreductase domain-containing protein n=1 Tax=Apiospora kogelbergensis TaxID=1337665 RepID=A0AAW0QMQ2_9PEZI
MGAIISVVLDHCRSLVAAIALLQDQVKDFEAALARASLSPGLPVSNPSTPYWTQNPPYPELVKQQSAELPSRVDVAIIGSGISGAAVAHSLLVLGAKNKSSSTEKNFDKVVVLEARDVCSGATARNGGHIKAAAYDVYPRFAKTMPRDRAVALTRFQLKHLDVLVNICKARGIDAAETRQVETVDLFLDKASFDKAVRNAKETKANLPEDATRTWQRQEAQEKFGTGETVAGAISYKAGAIWAYRFVTTIWHQLLAEFPDALSLETHTPVGAIRTDDPGAPKGYPYAVQTPRGTLFARNVVHATNGHASHLVPGLRRKITPAQAHMSAQKPGDLFSRDHDHGAHRSWGVVYKNSFDYVTQRPPNVDAGSSARHASQGDLLLGGGFVRSSKQGIDMIGLSDDGISLDGLTLAHIAGVFPAVFSPNWGGGAEFKQAWSGTLGFTGDLMPFVGKLGQSLTGRTTPPNAGASSGLDDEKPSGEWIAAGFAGEGMVWAWLTGTALGVIMSGREEEDMAGAPGWPAGRLEDWFPPEILVSEQRLRSADLINLTNQL